MDDRKKRINKKYKSYKCKLSNIKIYFMKLKDTSNERKTQGISVTFKKLKPWEYYEFLVPAKVEQMENRIEEPAMLH